MQIICGSMIAPDSRAGAAGRRSNAPFSKVEQRIIVQRVRPRRRSEPWAAPMSTDEADEDLMVLYQRGEVRAFELLLSRHRKPVFNFILRFVGDRETAADLLQEA